MSEEKVPNKATSHLSEDEKQQLYKNARAKAWYEGIWQTVGKCVFCDLKDKYILHEENGVVLTINIYPYIDGQMMAIPRRHISSLKDLTPSEWETMRKLSYIGKKMIKKVHGHKAMWNLIREGGEAAQMTVSDHLHMQLIPFDAKDLAQWNFRELQYTPLENVQKYKDAFEEFVDAYDKFENKYAKDESKKVVLDLLIIHKGKVLMQERKEEFKFEPDIFTLPGGHLDSNDPDLFSALKREVKEEVNYEISEDDIELINSQLSFLKHKVKIFKEHQTGKKNQFLWNTYLLKSFDVKQKLIPQDDCEEIVWVDLKEVKDHKKISPELKKIILKTAIKLKKEGKL